MIGVRIVGAAEVVVSACSTTDVAVSPTVVGTSVVADSSAAAVMGVVVDGDSGGIALGRAPLPVVRGRAVVGVVAVGVDGGGCAAGADGGGCGVVGASVEGGAGTAVVVVDGSVGGVGGSGFSSTTLVAADIVWARNASGSGV